MRLCLIESKVSFDNVAVAPSPPARVKANNLIKLSFAHFVFLDRSMNILIYLFLEVKKEISGKLGGLFQRKSGLVLLVPSHIEPLVVVKVKQALIESVPIVARLLTGQALSEVCSHFVIYIIHLYFLQLVE